MLEQKAVFESGNELAAFAAKQINYHVMGYYPITPSTQIAEQLDLMSAEGEHDIKMIPAEGEHSAAGICYGASVAGGRVFNATSANGLLYAIEQLPVQSGTRFPMIMNVACRSVSGPLSIKGDHSDIMYALNSGWLVFFAKSPQEVYDYNIIALKVAESVNLPAIVAYDGFFTSHQKRKACVFKNDKDVLDFLGEYTPKYTAVDPKHPVTIGSYMNEPDLTNNKYQLHMAMEKAKDIIPRIYEEFCDIAGRRHHICEGYMAKDADVLLLVLGSAFDTAREAVDTLREKQIKAGVVTVSVLRPFFCEEIYKSCSNAKVIVAADRQDSYGAGGGNFSIEIRAMLQKMQSSAKVITRIYGIGGRDFFVEDAEKIIGEGVALFEGKDVPDFDYIDKYSGNGKTDITEFYKPLICETPISVEYDQENKKMKVKGANPKDTTIVPKRIAPGHGACPGCGIPVNINLLMRGISGNVIILFQTGCGMVVTTAYPKTSFKVNYVHNLFQNGAATLSGIVEAFKERQKRGEIPEGDFTFIMVSGDGGLDIGLGSALGAAIRNHGMIIFEYDNGGYMNTGYQQSYSTPLGAKSSTSHVGEFKYGKPTLQKDNPQIFAATDMPYVATAAESNIADFIMKAAKAQKYAKEFGTAYIKAISACPLNWNSSPRHERDIIRAAVNSCYHPLYEVEQGITTINYNPEAKGDKVPVTDFLAMMGRTKHLCSEKFADVAEKIQTEIDKRWERLKEKNNNEKL